tara:strand:+ start:1052 stop:1573 length:522 start_codon:yes stop_codon:yes gene_type:complete
MISKNKKILIYLFFILLPFFGFQSNAEENQNTIEIKNPIFTTKSIDGSPYEIKAEKGLQRENYLDLFVIEAKLKTKKNIWIYLNADKGTFNQSSGEILLESNIEIYTEADEKIFAELANVNTNGKIITLSKNVKYQDSNIYILADKSIINDEFSTITYYGNVKSKILKNKSYE